MAAKDWAPLRDALWRHVREPLIRDYPEEWNTVNHGDTIPFNRLGYLANAGRITATDTTTTIRWYILAYGCQHFDALSALMCRPEFQDPVQHALNRPREKTWRRMIHSMFSGLLIHARFWPRVLHIDFGCGPGTASWAVIESVAGRASLTTVGHDHNPNMIALANAITGELIHDRKHLNSRFFADWRKFNKKVIRLTATRWTAVLVTVNSLFGQAFMNTDDIDRIVDLVSMVGERVRDVPMIAIGTHPNYAADAVNDAWQRIADVAGFEMRYGDTIPFQSWNPIRPGAYAPEDPRAWNRWRGEQAQLGHILEVGNG